MRTSKLRARASQSGFTLIELLVVIGIIALLAALLFPVFARVREKGREVNCLSNFQQVAHAFSLYLQDYDETMPPAQSGVYASTDWKDSTLWPQVLAPFSKSWRIFTCPSDPSATDAAYRLLRGVPANAPSQQWEFAKASFSDFGYNFIFLAPPPGSDGTRPEPTRLAAILRPATTILGAESSYDRQNGPGECLLYAPTVYNYWQGESAASGPPYGYVWPRHFGQATVTFVDNHCKPQTIDALKAGIDPATGQIVDPEKCLWDLK